MPGTRTLREASLEEPKLALQLCRASDELIVVLIVSQVVNEDCQRHKKAEECERRREIHSLLLGCKNAECPDRSQRQEREQLETNLGEFAELLGHVLVFREPRAVDVVGRCFQF